MKNKCTVFQIYLYNILLLNKQKNFKHLNKYSICYIFIIYLLYLLYVLYQYLGIEHMKTVSY